jgi:hypothetical protein
MKQLKLSLPKKQLDGTVTGLDLLLGTFSPVIIHQINFSMPARLVLCTDKQVQQHLINTSHQFSQHVPVGVVLHVASNVFWSEFNLDKPAIKDDHRRYFLYPQEWQPVTVQSKTGKLYAMIEARAGNEKHKATIEITLGVTI